MIKILLAGTWAGLVTIGAAYAGFNWQASRVVAPEAEKEKLFGGLENVKTKQISVPVIANGKVEGYIIAQFTFTVAAKTLKRLSVKPDAFLIDEAFKVIYAGDTVDLRQLRKHDLPRLATVISENVNKRLGQHLIEEVLIQEFKYLPKDSTRGGDK